MKKSDILQQLTEYTGKDYVPMHMPGAKRNTQRFQMGNPYGLDITEIDGFDNLHHAEGIIANAFGRCAKLFGAQETYFLVNGSSAGILSAVCGATHKHDKVIVARNCHQSVYHALYLNELNPVYLYPDMLYEETGICGGIRPEQVERALWENPDTAAVILTSPTYEGVVSDIIQITQTVHRFGAVLIVDEAHGAHFNFSSVFPDSAVICGADAVIQSIHKTLPALTQTALLHLNGPYIDRKRVQMYWDMYQTTSPSYILLGGIDRCMTILEEQGVRLFRDYTKRLYRLRQRLGQLKNIRLIETDDVSKVVLAVCDGKKLYDRLRNQYHIQLEMASVRYVIAMTSIGDTDLYYDRFMAAIEEIDADNRFFCSSGNTEEGRKFDKVPQYPRTTQVLSIYSACNAASHRVPLKASVGKTAGGAVCFYPPGIPLINAGEQIMPELIAVIEKGIACGLQETGLFWNQKGEVEIVCLK